MKRDSGKSVAAHEPRSVENKSCSKCDARKPPVEFHRNRRRADGHENVCARCRKAGGYGRRASSSSLASVGSTRGSGDVAALLEAIATLLRGGR